MDGPLGAQSQPDLPSEFPGQLGRRTETWCQKQNKQRQQNSAPWDTLTQLIMASLLVCLCCSVFVTLAEGPSLLRSTDVGCLTTIHNSKLQALLWPFGISDTHI